MAATSYGSSGSSTLAATPSAIPQDAAVSRGVTPRVVLLCIALAFLFGYIIPIVDVKLQNTYLGAAHLPPGAIAVLLFLLLVVNPLLKMSAKRFAFSRNELLTVYISCLFSTLVPGHGAENFFVPNLIGPYYFATAENRWLTFLNKTEFLRPWFTPALSGGPYSTDSAGYEAVHSWYGGGEHIPWGVWITPLVMWGSLVLAIYVMFACLSVILRAQWGEREALAFPLLRLPVEMTEDVDRNDKRGVLGDLFRNRVMWIGFGIVVFIQLLNGLNTYYPDVPKFPLEITGNFFSEVPMNQVGWMPFRALPIVIGISYLLTTEISLSLWFFFLFFKFQRIIAYYAGAPAATLPNMLGHTQGEKAAFGYQVLGAYLVYVAIVVWTGREHYLHVAKRAFGRTKARSEERDEALSYPVAFWGFTLAFAFAVGWCVVAGITPWVAIAMWTLYLVIAVALSRIIVEGGLLFVQQGWTPLPTLAQLFNAGPGTLIPPSTIVPASFVNAALMTDLRGFLLPSFIQSFKLAHDHKIRMKPLLALVMVVTMISFVMSLYMNVKLGYENGALTLQNWFVQGGAQKPGLDASLFINGVDQGVRSPYNWLWMFVGGTSTWLMMFARSRFLWFPFHPLGYFVCLVWPMYPLWFSIFLGWLAKVIVTKFGGNDSYRALIPGFLGLVLGDVFMMIVWLVVSGFTGHTQQQLMPS